MENEVDSFLQGLDNSPKDDPFKSDTEDPLNLTPKEEEKKEEKEEERLPFHKDPKVQKFIEKEIERRIPKTEVQTFVEDVRKDDEDPFTDVLTRIIGNDTPEKISAIKDFRKALDSRDERVRQETLREIDARVNEEKQAEIEAQNELIQGFEDIEETFNVDITSNNPAAQKTRSEFVEFVKRVAPKDEDGQVIEFPDLEETFKLFQDIKKTPTQPNRAKELASRSMNRSSDATTVEQPTDKSWRGVDKVFSKLFDK